MTARLSPALLAVVLVGCSGGSSAHDLGPAKGGTISGAVQGKQWSVVRSAYWIGKPSAGSAPVIVFLFETPKSCSDLALANWDKILGSTQLLEIAVVDAAVASYAIPSEADVAYLYDNYNPSADAGTVTVATVQPAQNITGTFDATFGSDSLAGTFDATYCAEGVEP
jgi:hypothetical protein